jgi:hypothetical protein
MDVAVDNVVPAGLEEPAEPGVEPGQVQTDSISEKLTAQSPDFRREDPRPAAQAAEIESKLAGIDPAKDLHQPCLDAAVIHGAEDVKDAKRFHPV